MAFSPQYLVAVNLALLAPVAYLASAIAGTALESRLSPPPIVKLSAPPPPIPPQASRPASYYELIHQRDIFNSVRPEEKSVVAPVPVTPLKLTLWGVALFENGGSYCVIEDKQKREQDLYGIGDVVPGEAEVKAIEWDRVVLNRGGKDEVLEIESASEGGLASRVERLGAARPGGRPPQVAEGTIQMTGENEYLIDRAEVDKALENMSQLFTQIRAVPHFEGGKSTGFRLFAIRRGSLFDKIGLKNGDIIQSINGSAMNDPSRAMALLQELRNEGDLEVELIRNRQPQSLTYTVR